MIVLCDVVFVYSVFYDYCKCCVNIVDYIGGVFFFVLFKVGDIVVCGFIYEDNGVVFGMGWG